MIPWRDARLEHYRASRLERKTISGSRLTLEYAAGDEHFGIVLESVPDRYIAGIVDLYIAAPDRMSGKPYLADTTVPQSVPHNTIYGIGTSQGDALLERASRLRKGSRLAGLVKILFSE